MATPPHGRSASSPCRYPHSTQTHTARAQPASIGGLVSTYSSFVIATTTRLIHSKVALHKSDTVSYKIQAPLPTHQDSWECHLQARRQIAIVGSQTMQLPLEQVALLPTLLMEQLEL